uniref:hypothetical protein n=1 Tax=Hydrogenophaga sp. TaxID=1904254 RepID=UPI00356A426C
MPDRSFDPRPTIRLDIGADETCLRVQTPGADARVFRLAVGCSGLFAGRDASGVPTPLAIEQAIQTVEDQIERVQRHMPRDADGVASARTLAPL